MTRKIQWQAHVLANHTSPGHVSLTLSDPGGASTTRPGQYAAITVGGSDSSMLLRRIAWIAADSDRPMPVGAIGVVASSAGSGGRWLEQLRRGDGVGVMSPLGRPFAMPREPVRCLLIGAGEGTAALLGLGRVLASRGCRVEFLLLTTAAAPYGLLEARRISSATYVVTMPRVRSAADVRTTVAEYVDDVDPDVVYSAGSADEVAPVAETVTSIGLPQQCALDLQAACGTGICAGCALPVRGNDGVSRLVRVCTEGPVFNADLVRWHDLRGVPEDAAGTTVAGGAS
jgi:dihydroorotate dehydrogenase electron transfer subunit